MTMIAYQKSPKWQPVKLSLSLCIALLLGLTWFIPSTQAAWQALDDKVFLSLNALLAEEQTFQWWVAFLNTRWFDLLLALLMTIPFMVPRPFWQHEARLRELLLFLFVLLLFVAVRLTAKKTFFDFDRDSPSLVFTGATILTQEIWGLTPRVSSGHSFPGDHAAVLICWAVYISYFRGKAWSVFAVGMALVFVLPRLIVGGHWLSDVFVGGLMLALITFSCAIFTPWRYYSEIGSAKVWQGLLTFCPEWIRRTLSLCEISQEEDSLGESKAR